jgi:hypothetical protein
MAGKQLANLRESANPCSGLWSIGRESGPLLLAVDAARGCAIDNDRNEATRFSPSRIWGRTIVRYLLNPKWVRRMPVSDSLD